MFQVYGQREGEREGGTKIGLKYVTRVSYVYIYIVKRETIYRGKTRETFAGPFI